MNLSDIKKRTIIIEVRGGVVIDVRGLPEGWEYELIDHDVEQHC